MSSQIRHICICIIVYMTYYRSDVTRRFFFCFVPIAVQQEVSVIACAETSGCASGRRTSEGTLTDQWRDIVILRRFLKMISILSWECEISNTIVYVTNFEYVYLRLLKKMLMPSLGPRGLCQIMKQGPKPPCLPCPAGTSCNWR